MRKLKKIFNFIGNVIFYCFLAVVIVAVVMLACGLRPYITMSGSMEPEIHTGSVCIVNTKADYENIQVGDIIAFKLSSGGLVTHRVISITEDGMETKGDANEVSDGISTTSENFHGKTLFSIPYVGYGIKALQEPQNVAIALVIIVAIFIMGQIGDRESKDPSEPDEKSSKDKNFSENEEMS